MAIFKIVKNWIWPKKKISEIDLFDFTSFLAWTFSYFLAYCATQNTLMLIGFCSNCNCKKLEAKNISHFYKEIILFIMYLFPSCLSAWFFKCSQFRNWGFFSIHVKTLIFWTKKITTTKYFSWIFVMIFFNFETVRTAVCPKLLHTTAALYFWGRNKKDEKNVIWKCLSPILVWYDSQNDFFPFLPCKLFLFCLLFLFQKIKIQNRWKKICILIWKTCIFI